MRLSRALRRRLDPWAVMLLGVLIALGVIILLATPGPWHRVLPVTPRVPAATPPRDVLIMVTRAVDDPRCVGALWAHVEYERPSVAVVVVPSRLTGLLPGAGMNPLADVVGHGGPAAGAAAAGEALGVEFEGWIAVSRDAVDEMVPLAAKGAEGSARRTIAQRSQRAWSGSAPFAWAYAVQAGDAGRYAAAWRPRLFSRGAFTNFVLGSSDAATDMKLQTLSALAAAIDRTARGDVTAGALPVVVFGNGAYERVRPEPLSTLVYRVAFTVDAPAQRGPRVSRVPVSRRVIVLTDAGPAERRRFARRLDATVDAHCPHEVRVVTVPCGTPEEVAQAFAERRGERPPLAAVAAFAGAGDAAVAASVLVDAAASAARRSCLPLVIAVAGDPAVDSTAVPAASAERSGFPWVTVAAMTGGREGPASAILLGDAAGECLVRAVSPRYFAPRLRATRVGFDYFDRSRLDLGLVGDAAGTTGTLAVRLNAMGYRPATLDDDGVSRALVPAVHYLPGSRSEALCLADDLGWQRSRVVVDTAAPAAVTIIVPDADGAP